MCGVASLIGTSLVPNVSHRLITGLFNEIESRGTDASGFWGLTPDDQKPTVLYHKSPLRASLFTDLSIWKDVEALQPNLLLVHARKTSPGIGHASVNTNNHPFVSSDKRIGVIHNGKIHEHSFLTDKYETKTKCDSEIILRMYEAAAWSPPTQIDGASSYVNQRLSGFLELWSVLKKGSCVTMVGEIHPDGTRTMMILKNVHRPLWFVDLRKKLGQVFFFSTPEIWKKAVAKTKLGMFIGNTNIYEVPNNELWSLRLDQEGKILQNNRVERIQLKKNYNVYSDWKHSGEKIPIADPVLDLAVYSELDDQENCPRDHREPVTYYSNNAWKGYSDSYTSEAGSTHVKKNQSDTAEQKSGDPLENTDGFPALNSGADVKIVDDEFEDYIPKQNRASTAISTKNLADQYEEDDFDFDSHEISQFYATITSYLEDARELLESIETDYHNNMFEQSVSVMQHEDLALQLEAIVENLTTARDSLT